MPDRIEIVDRTEILQVVEGGPKGDSGATSLDELTDVDLTGQADDHGLVRVGGLWVPRDVVLSVNGGFGDVVLDAADVGAETPVGAQAKVDAEAVARDLAIEAHRLDTTAVHGIPDTSVLETVSGAQAKVDAAVAALINGAPLALNELNELAAAMGNDPNFAATVINALAGKVALSSYDANSLLAADVDDTPTARVIVEDRIVGRITGGNIAGLTSTQVRALLAILEDAAAATASLRTLGTGATQALPGNHPVALTADVTAEATARTGADALLVPKGALLVNVKDYGAVGDGVADDTAEIAAALAAVPAAGGTLYFPAGDYLCTAILSVTRSNLSIKAEKGARLVVGSALGYLIHLGEQVAATRYSNLSVEGLAFYDPNPTAHVGTDETHGIVARQIDHLVIRHCRFTALGDEQVDLQSCTDVLVEKNWFTDGPSVSSAGAALGSNGSSYVTFRSNYFEGTSAVGAAMRVEAPDSGGADAAHILVEGNHVSQRSTTGIEISVGGAARKMQFVTVRDNVLDAVAKEAILVAGSGGAFERVYIVGNRVNGGGTGASTSDRGAIHCGATVTDLLVADNLLRGWGNANGHHGIVVQSGVVSRNVLNGIADDGIRLVTAGGILVIGNDVRLCGITSGNGSGVNLIASSDQNAIIANNLVGNQIGIEGQSGSDQNLIEANRVASSVAQGIRVRGEQYVKENILLANATGIQVVSGTGCNLIGNVFVGNTTDVTDSGTATVRISVAAGKLTFGGDTTLYRSAADVLATDDDLAVAVAGKGLRVKEGANAKMGTAVLVAGSATVATTAVTANSRIFLTAQNSSGAPGELSATARVAGTSFTIGSTSALDTRTVAWMIVEPA